MGSIEWVAAAGAPSGGMGGKQRWLGAGGAARTHADDTHTGPRPIEADRSLSPYTYLQIQVVLTRCLFGEDHG